tara:strand:+ start:22 stop:345 length:324 start_codon:yes stop_codon:yes gene_type:complete
MQQEQIDLGHKRTCPHCGAKYYDFYQDELDCPECGKSIEAVNITKPKRGRKAGVTVAASTKTVKDNDELKDLIEETEEAETQTEEAENLAEDISIDITSEKTEEETN